MDHREKAAELFVNGSNCAQAVAVAFCDVTGMEPELAAKLSSSFGGGMGRMREVCGAVSGLLMVLGVIIVVNSLRAYFSAQKGAETAKAAV